MANQAVQPQGQQAAQQLPFRLGSRQRKRQSTATQQVPAPVLGQSVNFILEKVGMLNYLVIFVKGTATISAAGPTFITGPWPLVDRIRVDLNLSNMNLVDIDGPMAHEMNAQMFRGWGPAGAGIWTPNPTSYSAPVAVGDNQWVVPFFIPISANPGDSFDTGLINMQAPEVQCNVQIRFTPNPTNVYPTLTTFTNATVEVHQCYFSSLDPRAVILPLGQVVRTIQFTQPVVATGENTITIERQGKLMQTLTRFIANGAPSDSIDRLQIVANINDTLYDETASFNSFEYERDYSRPRPVGVWYKDFWHAKEAPGSGDGRDLINLEVLTTFQQKLFVAQGTTLGSGNNFYHLGRRVLVNFVSPATSGINPLSQ
jgi:hypothetical protein